MKKQSVQSLNDYCLKDFAHTLRFSKTQFQHCGNATLRSLFLFFSGILPSRTPVHNKISKCFSLFQTFRIYYPLCLIQSSILTAQCTQWFLLVNSSRSTNDGGQFFPKENLNVRPYLIGFCPREGLEHTFAPGGSNTHKLGFQQTAEIYLHLLLISFSF